VEYEDKLRLYPKNFRSPYIPDKDLHPVGRLTDLIYGGCYA